MSDLSSWKLKRGAQEWPVKDATELQAWAKSGRIVPTDYIFNPTLDRWMLASEVPELTFVMDAKKRSASKGSCGLAIALFLFAVMLGMMNIGQGIGMILGGGAILFAIIAGILYVAGK